MQYGDATQNGDASFACYELPTSYPFVDRAAGGEQGMFLVYLTVSVGLEVRSWTDFPETCGVPCTLRRQHQIIMVHLLVCGLIPNGGIYFALGSMFIVQECEHNWGALSPLKTISTTYLGTPFKCLVCACIWGVGDCLDLNSLPLVAAVENKNGFNTLLQSRRGVHRTEG